MPRPQPRSQPFKYQTEAKVRAYGRRGQGGTVVIHDGEMYAEVELGRTSFDLLILLIEAAKHKRREDEPWAPSGFLSVRELQCEMAKQAGDKIHMPRTEPERVTKAIFRLREAIGEGLFDKGEWQSYVKRLLEKTKLGYRLSTEPSNLDLVFLDAS